MLKRLRIAVLVISALLFGTAQAACVCGSLESAGGSQHHSQTSHANADAHQAQSPHEGRSADDHDGALPADCSDGEPCGAHGDSQLTADTLVPAALKAPVKTIAVIALPSAPEVNTSALFPAKSSPILSRAPPGPHSNPVSMKVRLRN